MCSPQSPSRLSKGRSPRTAAGSLRPSQAQPFAHGASHPRRHPAASPQQPRDRPSGTYPAGQPRTAAAVRTPGARPSPPIPARSKDARAGPSADNQLDQTQSTSRRTQPVPAIEGGKKKFQLGSATMVSPGVGRAILFSSPNCPLKGIPVTVSAFIRWEVVSSTRQWAGLLSASGLQPLGCILIKMALCGVLFISTLLL